MSASAEKNEAAAVRQVSVNGYIDAITSNRIYGWAWDAQQPAAKITLRMQVNGKMVGVITADLPREDLKASGIGDGAHAFDAAIPEGVSPNDLKLMAVCPDTGQTVELAPRAIAGGTESNDASDLRIAVETLTKSHGFIHRKLQSIVAALEESRRQGTKGAASNALVVSTEADYAPMSRLQTLENAIVRLDDMMSPQTAANDSIHAAPADVMPRLLSGTAVILSLTALLIALFK